MIDVNLESKYMDRTFYQEALVRGRLFPFIENDRLVCFLTYNIVNDPQELISNPWKVINDTNEGNMCYVSQLISDRNSKNVDLFHRYWREFRQYIIDNHPTVTTISWRRWKGDKVHVYNKNIRE